MGYIGNRPTAVPLTSADIQDGVITAADLGANSVDSSELVDGSIDTSHIGAAQVTADKTSGVIRPNAQALIINGNCAISQRSTSVASITGSGYHTIDRYRTGFSGTLGTWTQSQSTDVPTGKGFANSLKMDCTTADASPSVGDRLSIRYNFEGQDLQLLKKGTADAEKITLAFWIKSSKTGVHIVNIVDQDNTRNISKSYTVSSADTWEQVVLNFDGDTTGALGDDNGQSLYVDFYFGAGTNYTSGTLATSWEAVNNVDIAVGQVNLADSTSNDFLFTGVQLEVGEYTSSTLPPFQHESYGDNLRRCQRYFYKLGGTTDTYKRLSVNFCNPSNRNQTLGLHHLPVPMRTAQTVTIPSASDFAVGHLGGSNACSSVTINNDGALPNNALLSCLAITGSNASTDCVMLEMTYASTNTMEVSAEL